MSFKALHLNKSIVKAIEEAGYTEPTLIQEQTIPFVIRQKGMS